MSLPDRTHIDLRPPTYDSLRNLVVAYAGDMFWQWVDDKAPMRTSNAVRAQDSTFKVIKKHARLVTKYGTGRQLCYATY